MLLPNLLHGSSLQSYATCPPSAHEQVSDLGQHSPTNKPQMSGTKQVEPAQAGTTKSCQAGRTITSRRLALLDLLDVSQAISTRGGAVPGAVNRGGRGSGGCSATDPRGTCLLIAINNAERSPVPSAVVRDELVLRVVAQPDSPRTSSQ